MNILSVKLYHLIIFLLDKFYRTFKQNKQIFVIILYIITKTILYINGYIYYIYVHNQYIPYKYIL